MLTTAVNAFNDKYNAKGWDNDTLDNDIFHYWYLRPPSSEKWLCRFGRSLCICATLVLLLLVALWTGASCTILACINSTRGTEVWLRSDDNSIHFLLIFKPPQHTLIYLANRSHSPPGSAICAIPDEGFVSLIAASFCTVVVMVRQKCDARHGNCAVLASQCPIVFYRAYTATFAVNDPVAQQQLQ